MRPVYQTRTTGSKCDIEERGDCFQACVASILEISLEEAFDIWKAKRPLFPEFNKWLQKYGLYCKYKPYESKQQIKKVKGYHMAGVKSTYIEGEHHVVVIKDGEFAHDPNPHATSIGDLECLLLILPIEECL